jgi:hypothetical protein
MQREREGTRNMHYIFLVKSRERNEILGLDLEDSL